MRFLSQNYVVIIARRSFQLFRIVYIKHSPGKEHHLTLWLLNKGKRSFAPSGFLVLFCFKEQFMEMWFESLGE